MNSATTNNNIVSESAVMQRFRVAQTRSRIEKRDSIEVLEEEVGIPPAQFMEWLSGALSYPWLSMQALHQRQPAFDLLSYADSTRRRCVLAREGEKLIAIVANPFDLNTRHWIEAHFGAVQWHLAHRDELAAWFAIHEESLHAIESAQDEAEPAGDAGRVVEDVSLSSIADSTSPVIRLINSTIYDAMKVGASDIHLESLGDALQIKYRIDGVLTKITLAKGKEFAEQAVSRIKIMAELDIGEKRIPQDGRFKLSIRGQETDFRVSIMPSIHGEDVVVRVLDKRALTGRLQALSLDHLGFDETSLRSIRQMIREPYGMFLVTGPTGSGKTTTLYGAISEINNGQDKIVTIEDPVEYQLPGILQIPVNERKGLTFAKGLRSILRHDPDKILVGEIRDPETAQIAVQSALTGHLVFTSVHANNVFDVLGRFLHMGVDTYSFVSALNGILAQRLVRLVCSECAVDKQPLEDELLASGISSEQAADIKFVSGRGCGRCRGSGYRGRVAIAEVLRLNDELRELIAARAPIRLIKEAALKSGTRFLRHSALDLLRDGRTTLEEINRVTFVA